MLDSNPSQKIKVGWRGTPFTFIAHMSLPLKYSHHSQTPWSVFLDGSVAGVPSAGIAAVVEPGSPKPTWGLCHSNNRGEPACPKCTPSRGLNQTREAASKWVSSCRFQALFNSLFKVLCIFPSRYLFAIGHEPIFSFRWNLPPTSSCNPKQPDSARVHRAAASRHGTGFSPSPIPRSRGFERRSRPMAPF